MKSLFLFLFGFDLLLSPVYSLCPLPPMVANAVGNTGHDKLNGYYIEYSCNLGYYIGYGDSRLKCSNGTINGNLPTCMMITCSKCITLNYGKSNCNSSRTYNYNSTVEYWCDSGFISYGNNSLRCGDNGSWVIDNDTFRMTCNASKTYIGCYDMENVTSTSTNIDNCRLDCQRNGYHYAGFNNAGCACGNTLTNQASNQCQERCNINGTVTCGGTGNIRTTHYSFYGCYTDSTVPTITIKFQADSTKNCIEYCRLRNKRYALLLSFDKCSCQDLVSITATPVETKRCQFRNVTNVYFVRIIDLEKFYASCQDLYKAGVHYHGDYVLGKNRKLTTCNFKDGTICDHQWIGYKGACYHFNSGNKTFQDSLSYCASLNSDLASIHDRDEVDFLKQTITEFQDLKQQPNWYIGLYDSLQSSNYLWSDGTLKVFNDFIQERPSKNYWQCVHLMANGWTDTPCWVPAGVICKKKQNANQCLSLTNTTSESKYITHDPDMNPGLCFQICRGLNMPISAVNTVTCHCYLTMPQHSVLNWTECSKYCKSNNHQNCGGDQNIFFVTKESGQPKALSCNELQLQVMANSFTQDSAGVPLCPGNSTNSCPHTWIASHNSCYKFFESRVLYNDAVEQCIKNNAYIVSINDATEESRLLAIIQKIQVFQNIFEWWIGLTNVQHLGVFRWSDGQPVSYNKITNMKYNDVTWIPIKNMWSTSNNYQAFICEKDSAFRGCYKDISQASVITSTVDMTVNMCVELCRGRIKNYALLEEYLCYCSDNISTQATCDTKATCKAQPNQLCGKYPVFAAYQVDQFKKFANNCQDLLFEGITAPTVYVLEDKRKNCDFRGNVSICPSDTRTWIGFDGQCYLLVNETKSWVEAQNYCLSIGSTLASISDEQHLEFLIKSIKPRYSLTYHATVWLGGSDDIYEGFYSWVDGNLLSKKQSKAIGTGEQYHLALVKPSYQLTKTKTTLGYILCQITKDYRGCFQTPASSSPNITILVTTENLVSVNLCKQLCLGRNFNYSLTNQKSCACMNNHTSLTLVDDKKCQNPCPSQKLLLCGSQDTWALHLLDSSRLATHCSQLAINGIFLNATYKLWNSTKGSSEFKQCGQADNSSCPIGWVGKDGVCYDFSTKKTKLSEARNICFSKSAILSFPVNAVARKFIVDMVNAVPTIWPLGKFFVGVQTFNRGSYVAATGKIIKSDNDIPTSFNQLTLTWSNTYSTPSSTSLEYFICEKFSGYKGCASLSNQQQSVSLTTLAMTATQCLEFCRGQEFSLAAVNTTSCFCLKADEVLSWQPKSSIDWCFQSCPGFDNQPCGGKNVFSVYEADQNASLPDSCDELVNLGVTAKSTYKLQPNNYTSILKTTCFSTGGYAEGIQPNNYIFTSKQASFSTTDLRVHIFPTMSNAWKPASVNGQWVEVALPSLYTVTGIRTRGVMKPNERWVMSYELFYGDASPGYLAPYSENNITEFQANTDGNSVVTRLFRKPFVANTIRLVVKQSHISIALGFEFLGQPYEHVFASNKAIGCFAGDNSTGNVLATATTKDDCKKTCLANGYPIYGIQEKKGTFMCKCVLSFGKYGQLNDTECLSDSNVSPFILYRTFEMACQSPDLVNWAKIIPLSNPVQGKYAYNMKVMYTCILGYEFPDKSNSSIVKCLENNQWESLPGNCSRKHCSAIPKVNHTTTDTNDTFFGSKVTYQCHPGFMFTNYQVSFTIECLASGTWNTTVPSCVGMKCKDPSPPANSRLTARNNTHATFICNKGFYFLDGFTEKTFICQQNVTWAFNNEECQAPDPFHRQNTVTQGEENKRIATPSYSLHVRSLLDCISKCMQHMTCSILSLHTQSSNEGANCDLFLGTRPQIILTDAPGWNMYYMRLIR